MRRAGRIAVPALLLLVAGALRAWFVLNLHPPSWYVFSDMSGFLLRAQNLLDGEFPATSLVFPPGEHLLLALSGWLFDGYDTLLLAAHILASLLTCLFVFLGSRRILGRAEAVAALVAISFHFPLLAYAGFYMSETVFGAFLAALFWLLARFAFPWRPGQAWILGLLLGFALVFKGTGAFLVPLLLAWTILRVRHRIRAAARPVAAAWTAFLGGLLVVLLAQGAYFAQHGRFLLVSAAGGCNFALGKCPGMRIVDGNGDWFASPRTRYTGESGEQVYPMPFHEQAAFWRAGLACVLRDPLVLVRAGRDVGYLFGGNEPWPANMGPFAELSSRASRLFTWVALPGAAWGGLLLLRRPFSRRAPSFLLAGAVCFSAWVFQAEMRYRIPFDVAFVPLAVYGWTRLFAIPLRFVPARLATRRFLAAAIVAGAWMVLFGIPMVTRFVES